MAGTLPVIAACLSGVAFALMGVGYRLAQPRGFAPTHLLVISGVVGTVLFGLRMSAVAPPWVLVLGAVSGLGQYAAILLVRPALKLGPLSPMWCVLSLGFVPSAVYALAVHGKQMSGWQWAGVALATGAVILASLQQQEEGDHRERRWGLYGAILVCLFVTNSLVAVAMGDLKARPWGESTLFEVHGVAFMAAMYVACGACVCGDLLLALVRARREGKALYNWGPFLGLGLLLAFGSNAGMVLNQLSMALPPGITFTLQGVIQLLAGALASVAFFGERPGLVWVGMMAMAAAAVPLMALT